MAFRSKPPVSIAGHGPRGILATTVSARSLTLDAEPGFGILI
jgi:hypothetical protein